MVGYILQKSYRKLFCISADIILVTTALFLKLKQYNIELVSLDTVL